MIDALLHSWFLLKKNTDYLFKGLNKLSFLFIYFFLFLFYFAYINFYNVPEDSFIYSGDQFLRFSKYETDANSFFLRKEENFGVHNCWQQMTQFWDILYFQFIYQFSFTYTTVITIQYSVALAITFILSFIGFHLINYEILKNRNLFNVFLVTFLYTINPYTGQLWHGLVYIIGLSLTYSSFPLIFYYIYTSGIKKITLIELILFITIAFIASFAFWLFAVTVFLGIFEFIILLLHKKIKLKYFLYNLSIFAVVYLLLATPIIYSIFFEMYNNGGDNNGTFSGTFGNMQGGIWYQALLLFSWAIYTVWHPRALYPFHEFYFSIPYIGSTISLYLIILSGFAYAIYRRIRRKFKVHYLWIVGLLLLIVSLFFAKGAQAPFGEVFQYLYDNTSFFKVFRSSDIRFGFTVIFSISLLLLLTIQILPNRVLKLFLIGLILTQNIYFFTGDAIRGMNVSDEKGIKFVDHIITIPQDYKEIAATINLDTEYYYVLFYPPTEYGFFKIKDDFHLGQNLESKLLQNPSLQLSSSNGMSKANFEKLSEIFETKKYDQLEFYSIKYVIVQKDMLGNEKVEDICKEFDSSKVFRKKYENPTFTLYENLIFKPIIHSQDDLDLKFSKLNPDKFIIKLKNEKDTQINFAQNYSEHWSLVQISNEMYSSYLNETSVNSFINLFKDFRFAFFSKEKEIQRNQEIKFTNQWNVLKNNDSKLDDQYFLLIYKPQVIYELLIFISVIVFSVIGISVLLNSIRKGKYVFSFSKEGYNMKRNLSNSILVVTSLLISIYTCEFIVRTLYFMPNPISRYYPLKRSLMGTGFDVIQYEYKIKYRYNQFGFRDENWKLDKDGKTKILLVGDSFAEGFGVEENERFGNIIEENINNKVSVYNAGQLATNPLQYYHNMIDFGIALSPKVIIFSLFMGNDFQGGRNDLIKNDKTPNKYFAAFEKNHSNLNSFLSLDYLIALINQLNKKSDIIIRRTNENIPYWEMYFNTKMNEKFFASNLKITVEELRNITKNKIDPELYKQFTDGMIIPSLFNESVGTLLGRNVIQSYNEEDYLNTISIIKEAQRVSQNENIEFIVLIIPDIYKALGDDYVKYTCEKLSLCNKPDNIKQLESLYNRLILDLNKNHIKYIDALPDLKNQPTYHLLDMHFNKNGHAVIAKRLEHELQEIIKDKE